MINFSGVTKLYGDEVILKDITLNIEKGELVYLTGLSGAGKTTLLKLIYCAILPDEGHIVVANWDVRKLKQRTIPYLRRNIGIVFQDFRLLQNKTVFDNVALALRIHDMPTSEIKDNVYEVLHDVKLKHKANTYPQYLSGGEQQRVVIARAMVAKPTVFLADEPTGNLDNENAEIIINLFRDINARGTTVMIATHNEALFQGTGRRVIHISDTRIDKEIIG
jgi:cell division transport system ATP-binding protein